MASMSGGGGGALQLGWQATGNSYGQPARPTSIMRPTSIWEFPPPPPHSNLKPQTHHKCKLLCGVAGSPRPPCCNVVFATRLGKHGASVARRRKPFLLANLSVESYGCSPIAFGLGRPLALRTFPSGCTCTCNCASLGLPWLRRLAPSAPRWHATERIPCARCFQQLAGQVYSHNVWRAIHNGVVAA